MEFKINNKDWKIIEVNEKDIIEKLQSYEDEEKIIMANGLTDFQQQLILLNEDLHIQTKRTTLLHELMHCYIRSYFAFEMLNKIPEELLCDISANSHDIIHEIVERYFRGK